MSAPTLTLKELQALAADASVLEAQAKAAKSMEEYLAGIRTGSDSLAKVYASLFESSYSWQVERRDLIGAIIDEHAADLLRIAEMRQAAKARELRVKAAEKRAQLATIVAPEPQDTGAAS